MRLVYPDLENYVLFVFPCFRFYVLLMFCLCFSFMFYLCFLNRMRPWSVRLSSAWTKAHQKEHKSSAHRHAEAEKRRGLPRSPSSTQVSGDSEAVAGRGCTPGSAMPCPREQSSRTAGTPTYPQKDVMKGRNKRSQRRGSPSRPPPAPRHVATKRESIEE